VEASILDEGAVAEAMRGCRWVFHEAALASVPQSVAEPERFYRVNVMGTLAVLMAAKKAGVRRVMYAGSSSAYGDPPEQGPKNETMPALPVSPYASAKLAGEEMMRAWAHSYGLDTAVLRYFNVFGPRQNANSAYAAVIAAFATALAAGRRPMIFGDGRQTRDFVYVANVVHANLLAAACEGPVMGEVFNVGTGRCITVNELYATVAGAMGKGDVEPEYRPVRAGDVLHSTADVSKATRVLGYRPVVEFAAGVVLGGGGGETVGWYGAARGRE
jgi:nucleoside-diphosphate-sugar epimerase